MEVLQRIGSLGLNDSTVPGVPLYLADFFRFLEEISLLFLDKSFSIFRLIAYVLAG